MIRQLRCCGLQAEDLLELRPGPDATTRYPFVTLEWSREWPYEEGWKAPQILLNQSAGKGIRTGR